MKEILTIDFYDYQDSWNIIKREAAKGVIFINGKLIMLQSRLGDLKFVGGGMEKDETPMDCLIREVMEETGYLVIRETIKELGIVTERRKDTYEDAIWEMTTYLYYCQIDKEQQKDLQLTDSEKEQGMNYILSTPYEAIQVNTNALKQENCNPWVYRELEILKHLFKNELVNK